MILVAGSAHLDVISKMSGDDKDVLDKRGVVGITVGGTAGNLAVNLAGMGAGVRFLTAMNDSAYSEIILTHFKNRGIEIAVLRDHNLPLAAFVAHIDDRGELVSAVSSMPVDRIRFPEQLIASVMTGVDALVVDCNLSPQGLLDLVEAANHRGLPVYIASVSEPKIVRARSVLASCRVEALFCNRIESERLLRDSGFENHVRAAASFGGAMVITDGPKDVIMAMDGAETRVSVTPVPVSGNTLGAGDMLVARTVMSRIQGHPFDLALSDGVRAASEILIKNNCNGASQDAFEEIISAARNQSTFDGLTGLLNRAALTDAAETMIAQARREGLSLAVMMFDVDHFKSVNDTWGHAAGDEVLRGISMATKSTLREGDVLGRWGGEEFVCVLMGADHDASILIGERIRSIIERTITSPRVVTVSGGISTLGSEDTFEALVKRADELLYESKKSGRNRVLVESSPGLSKDPS